MKGTFQNVATGKCLTYGQLFDELCHRSMESVVWTLLNKNQRSNLAWDLKLEEYFDADTEANNNEVMGVLFWEDL